MEYLQENFSKYKHDTVMAHRLEKGDIFTTRLLPEYNKIILIENG